MAPMRVEMTESSRPRILYVEDDRALARLIRKYLERAGYEIDIAYDGAEGLAMFKAQRYDLVALDFDLPIHDGLTIVRNLAPLENLPPIIMVTGCGDQSVAVEALKLGVADYILKDSTGSYLNLLPLVIRQVLDQRRLLQGKQRAELEIVRSEERYRSLVETSGDCVWEVDLQGRYTYVSPKVETVLGYQPAEILGVKLFDLLEPAEARRILRLIGDHLRHRDPIRNLQTVLRHKQGRRVILETSAAPIFDCDGVFRGYRGIDRDITERMRMEQNLAQAQKLEAVGQLAAGIAHEINTPIQYIGDNTRFLLEAFQGFGQLLTVLEQLIEACKSGTAKDTLVGRAEEAIRQSDVVYFAEEVPRAAQQSLEGVDRVARIVRAIKEFAHPGTEEKHAVDLNRAVDNTLTLARNEWKYVAEMVTDFDPNLPPVFCLPSDINQVVLNLVVNAAQAIAERTGNRPNAKGVIAVATRRDGPWAEISIRDTGNGIPEEIHSKIFNPFFTTKEIGRGTGQGLSIAHSLVVEKHGGTIEFQTELGVGTTFFVRLPTDGRPVVSSVERTETPEATPL